MTAWIKERIVDSSQGRPETPTSERPVQHTCNEALNSSVTSHDRKTPHTNSSTGNVYQNLARHQKTESWFGKDIIETLQLWAGRFNEEFKLEIPEVSLAIDSLRCTTLGHFRYGHNGFGLKGEIALNIRYLFGQREAWEVLGTLLHELLHAWQQAHGKPGKGNYHNREFRDKAKSLGLLIDKRGVTGYAAESLFKDMLRRFDVVVPFFEVPLPRVRDKGNSKLKKWSCGCFNVWCAKPDLDARCMKCGQRFRRDLPDQIEE